MKQLLILILFFGAVQVFAQPRVNGSITSELGTPQLVGQKLYLSCYKGNKTLAKDIYRFTNTTGQYQLDASKYPTKGFCALKMRGGYEVPLIINNQTDISLPPITIEAMKRNESVIQTEENKAYDAFMALYNPFKADVNALPKKFMSGGKWTDFPAFTKAYWDRRQQLSKAVAAVQKQYPNTYVGEYICSLVELPENGSFSSYPEATHKQFFKAWKIIDRASIYNFVVTEQIDFYLKYFATVDGKLYGGIDNIITPFLLKPEAKEYIVKYLLEKMIDDNGTQDVYAEYLYNNYIDGCMDEEAIAKFDKYNNVLVGKTAPKMASLNKNGQMVSVQSLLGSKPTIIYVWKTNCPYCNKMSPEIQAVAKSYGGDVQVYALSVDKSKDAWLKKVNTRNMPYWTDVCDFKGFKTSALDEYYIEGTPSVFLLDAEGKIITKSKSIRNLRGEINALLKK